MVDLHKPGDDVRFESLGASRTEHMHPTCSRLLCRALLIV